MLGQKLGGSSGKIIGMRVLPSDGQQVYVEVSFQGRGTLLGQDFTDVGTYQQTVRPGGVLYGEGHVLMMTATGDVADWIGGGVGKQLGAGFKASYGVYGAFQSASGKLEQLTTAATAIEYEIDEDGSYRWQAWEWTGAGVPQPAGAAAR
jgi:hypothetical protein